MNILWIEDHTDIQNLKNELFPELESYAQLISALSFEDAYDKIVNHLYDYDYVIIDINLSNWSIGEKGKQLCKMFYENDENSFKEEAGFQLYIILLEKGFPKYRIRFITGNTNKNYLNFYEDRDALTRINEEKEYIKKVKEIENKLIPLRMENEFKESLEKGNELEFLEKLDNKLILESDVKLSYEKYYEKFWNAKIRPPMEFHKDDRENINRWVKDNFDREWISKKNKGYLETFDFLTLRRGILEACKEIKEELKGKSSGELSKFLLFFQTVKDRVNYEEMEDYREHGFFYLERIYNYALSLDIKNKEIHYTILLKELSSDWENSYGSFNHDAHLNFSRHGLEYNAKESFNLMMKLLRNWSAHLLLPEKLNEKTIAFLFIIAMRAYYNMPIHRIYKYEKILGRLFTKTDATEFKSDILLSSLCDSYSYLLKFCNQHGIKYTSFYFQDLVIDFGDKRKNNIERQIIKKEAIKLLFQFYFHGLFRPKIQQNLQKSGKQSEIVINSVTFTIPSEFWDSDSDNFTYYLGSLILHECR